MKRVKEQREREILRNTDREGDNGGENQFTYRLYQMTKEKRAINTHSTI